MEGVESLRNSLGLWGRTASSVVKVVISVLTNSEEVIGGGVDGSPYCSAGSVIGGHGRGSDLMVLRGLYFYSSTIRVCSASKRKKRKIPSHNFESPM